MKTLYTFYKKAEKDKNRIIIPKFVIDNFGREFCLEVLEDGSMKLTPIKILLKKGK